MALRRGSRPARDRKVIDGIATAAHELIDALLKRSSGTVDLATSTLARRPGRRRPNGQAGSRPKLNDTKTVRSRRGAQAAQVSTAKPAASAASAHAEGAVRSKAPTDKMVAYARNLARSKKVTLPDGYQQDFNACRRFLDEHARKELVARTQREFGRRQEKNSVTNRVMSQRNLGSGPLAHTRIHILVYLVTSGAHSPHRRRRAAECRRIE